MGRDEERNEGIGEVPVKKRKKSDIDQRNAKRRQSGENQAELRKKKRTVPREDAGADAASKDRQTTPEHAGQGLKKKKLRNSADHSETGGQTANRKRPAADDGTVRKKKRPVAPDDSGSEETARKKKRPASADGTGGEEPVRKKKRQAPSADAEGREPAKKKKRPADGTGGAEPARKKKRPVSSDGAERTGQTKKRKKSEGAEAATRAEREEAGKPKFVETVNADGVRERRASSYSFLPDEPEPDLEALKKQKEEEEQKELESGLLAEEELREAENSEEERRARRRAAKVRAAKKRAAEQRKMRRIAIAAGCLVVILLIAFLVMHRLSGGNSAESDSRGTADAAGTTAQSEGTDISAIPADESVAQAAVITPEPVSTSITLTFTGDCTFGRDESFDYDTSFDAFYEENGYEYFFANCKSIFEQDDLTVVNFEGTLTNAGSSERADKQYAFKADPSYVKIMSTASVEAANMANNHSEDYGEQSYYDTLQYLTEAGITPFGYSDSKVIDVKGVKVGLVGILELFEEMDCQDDMIAQIEAVKAQGAQVVVVTMHWGEEAQYYYDQDQYDLGRIAIDHGADLVIGHHPHRIQTIETYKGKNIVYSLANFCFGGNFEPSDMDSFIYQQTFTLNGGQLVEDNVTKIIPISISSSSSYNNYQPTPYEDQDEIDRILFKIADLTVEPGVPLTGDSSGEGESSDGGTSDEGGTDEEYSEENDEGDSEEYSEDY